MLRLAKYFATTAYIGIILIGCGGSNITVIRPMETNLPQDQTVYFSAESGVPEDVSEELVNFEHWMALELTEKAVFDSVALGVCQDSCANVLNLKAVVIDIKKVSSSQRFWGGMFAGKASMSADLFVMDATTGDTLGIYQVTGKSGGTGMSGGTDSAVYATVKAMVELLQGKSY